MLRPLWGVAVVYAGGVVAGRWLAAPVEVPFLLFGGLLAAALLAPAARRWLLPAAVFCAGWTHLAARTTVLSPYDLRVLAGPRAELVTVRGRLAEPPVERVFEPDTEDESWTTHTTVELEALARQGAWEPARGRLAVTARGRLDPGFVAGRRVEVFGVLAEPRGRLAEGLFDYRAWLRLRGIHFQLQTQSAGDWRLPDPGGPAPWTERFTRWAKRTLARGLPVEDEPLRLSWAMALGWKTALTDEVSEPFMRTGTMHIFAISGLHIAFIAGILVALLRVVRVPRPACGVIAVPLIWFYTGATGWQPSAIRSTIMMTILLAGWALRRPGDLLNSLGAAAFIILVWQPEQLFQASFQLSFFVVLSIALLLPPIQERVQRLLAPDPLLPPELRPRWRRRLDAPARGLTLSFATSLAAWLGSLPLTALYFNLLTPVSLVANLVIVPLSSLALASSLGSLLCGDWLPWLGELFNHASWVLLAAMNGLTGWFARWPGAFWHVPAPTPWEVGAYFGLVLAVISGWVFQGARWRWCAPALAVVLGVLGLVRWLPSRGLTEITVLPLAGGEAVWVDAPGRRGDLLLDCGGERAAERTLKPFLRARGVNALPLLVLSHGDLRNVGGWPLIAREFHVRQTATGPARFRSPAFRRIVAALEQEPGRARVLARGDMLGPWRVLHPAPGDAFEQADDGALVLLGEIHGTRVLLLSDLGRAGQGLLLQREPGLRADIVVAGLPAQGEPLGDALLAVSRPRLVILTDSAEPATQRAGARVRERLRQRAPAVLFTSEEGGLQLVCRQPGWGVRRGDGAWLGGLPAP